MAKTLKDYLLISLKGMGMGAADIIPGVSGGTIALISGIYEEFIDALKSFSSVLGILKNNGIKPAWNHINGNFLMALFIGIGISLISLVNFIKYALENHAVLLWSFFFGLIVSSSYYVGKAISNWDFKKILSLLIGALLIFYLTSTVPSNSSNAYPMIFLAGMLAICAMILPGISGSFILVLIGKYTYIIDSLSQFKLDVIATFSAGCIVGLLSFSHLLSFLLKKYHDLTIALLTGFMIGSLNKIWPWKNTLEWGTDRHGEKIPWIQENVLPSSFSENDPQVVLAAVFALAGLILIFALENLAKRIKSNS